MNLSRPLAVLGLTLMAAPPLWAQEYGQGLLEAARSAPLVEGWRRQATGDQVTFANAGSSESYQTILYAPVPLSGKIRSSLMLVGLNSTDPRAYVGAVMMSSGGFCLLGLYPDKFVDLNCSVNGQTEKLGQQPDLLTLDGKDRIQVIEDGRMSIFMVNQQEIGRIENHPAQGDRFGFIAGGQGEFGLNYFSVAHMTAEELGIAPAQPGQTPPQPQQPQQPPQTTAPPPPPQPKAPPPPPQPPAGAAAPGVRPPQEMFAGALAPRAGWIEQEIPGGFATTNADLQGDERSFPLALEPMGGNLRLTEVDVTLGRAGSGPQSLRAAAGLAWENPQQGQSCGLQVVASGDAILLCYGADGRGLEVGRLRGAAQGPGPHRLSVLEEGDMLMAFVNEVEVGKLQGHPATGGVMVLSAWDRGQFGFTGLRAQVMARSPESQTQTRPPEPRATQSMGEGLSGPLPLFEGNAPRAAAAYLGVTKSILMHEIGHALIGELGVPSTGPEEDAVDIYSALYLAEAAVLPSGRAEQDAIASEAATYATLLWYYSGQIEEQQARAAPAAAAASGWQDEHTGGLKRFRNMFCVIYGANPQRFSSLAAAVRLEERTLARCEDEFLKQNRAWRAILSPYTRLSAEMPEGRLPASAPGAAVEVVLQPSRRQIGEYMRRTHGPELIAAAEAIGRHYALPRPLQVVFQDCDTVNAWYAPAEGRVTMCYDIVEHFIALISDVETGSQGGFTPEELRLASAAPAQAPSQAPTQAPAVGQPPVASAGGPSGGQSGGQVGGTALVASVQELQDFGIPASTRLFGPPFRGPTPLDNPKARTLTTPEVKALLDRDLEAIVLDIRRSDGIESLPMAIQLRGAGRDGSLEDGFQARLASVLADLTQGQTDAPVVVVGEDVEDRAAWNAALRIGQAGYAAYWYRGGIAAWAAAGLPLHPVK